jgi:uncharacterized protein YkwD
VDEKSFQGPGGKRIVTQEGVKAVDEAIAALRKMKPASALLNSGGLFLAAKAHVDDIGPGGITGHKGTDGSMPEERIKRFGTAVAGCGENIAFGPEQAREIVMQLIVDDGVPDRGHRRNIYNDQYKTVGVCIGSHEKYGTMCVMDFAGGFTENREAQRKLRELEKSRSK